MIENVKDLSQTSWIKIQKLRPQFDSESEWQKFRLVAARKCFLLYCQVICESIGINFEIEPFHILMADAFEDIFHQRYHRLIVSAPPRAGKSFMASLFISWLIGINDENFHIISSYGSRLSGTLYKQVRQFLTVDMFRAIFPNFSGFEASKKYELAGGGDVLSTSVGGPLTGFTAGTKSKDSVGIGCLLVDDPLKSAYSMAAIEEVHNWWITQASTRRTNRWAQIIIATRFHTNDLHGFLMRKDGLYDPESNPFGWRWVNLQALCENEATDILCRKNGESFWPTSSLFSEDILQSQKKTMGENSFSAMYQGEPISEGGSLFKSSYFAHRDLGNLYVPTKFISADTALEETESACQSVITVFGVTQSSNEIVVYEQIAGKWDFVDLLDNSIEVAKHYEAKWYVIEDKVSGKSLRQVLSKKTDFRTEIVAIKPIRSKLLRLQKVLPLFEDNKVKFPLENKTWFPLLKEGLMNAPLITDQQWDYVDSMVNGLLYFQEFLDSDGSSTHVQNVVKWGQNTKFKRNVESFWR